MFGLGISPEAEALDKAILRTFISLSKFEPESKEYSATADQIAKLMELKKKIDSSWVPSPDAVVGLVGTVLTAVLVLHYEKVGVVTSKAFGFVGKMLK